MNELHGLAKRFEIPSGDVILEDQLLPSEYAVQEETNDRIVLTSRGEKDGVVKADMYKVVIHYAPLTMQTFVDGQIAIVSNARGLLNFEKMRAKEEEHDAAAAVPVDGADSNGHTPTGTEEDSKDKIVADATAIDSEHLWTESFAGHTDNKQFGPTSVGLDFTFSNSRHLYGIPEHASKVTLESTTEGEPYRLYNLDVFEYDLNSRAALYGAIPLILSHDLSKTVGLFWVNPSETWIDVSQINDESGNPGSSTHWYSESGIMDVFFLLGPSPRKVFSQYASITGTAPLPQYFSIAYHQCRWNYRDQEDVSTVDAGFDEHDIPYDVIWLDIEHTDGKKYFTWSGAHFPEPEKMLKAIDDKKRKMVTIIDPHIKRDPGYSVHTEGTSKGYYVKKPNGEDFDGWCWPGSSSYLDFVNPQVRSWWADLFKFDSYRGSAPNLYTWNDMNEPSVFNGPEITMSKDNRHLDGTEHRDLHNLYGMYYHRATFEGHLTRQNNKDRPFVLSRSFFAGSQRFGAVWTGDNMAQWSHLAAANPMLLSLNLAGLPFVGADVGGFFGNPDKELLVRWYQAGAFYPFFRGHAHIETARREPWLFGEPTTSMIRQAIRVRYALLPFWYTLFRHHELTGEPILRPLWVEYTQDENTFGMEDQFLVGSDLLVKPVTESNQKTTTVYLPGSEPWYDYYTRTRYAPGDYRVELVQHSIPVYQRGGSILPRQDRPRRNSAVMRHDPYTLVVALDSKYKAKGELYKDDGQSFDYKNGAFIHRVFTFADNKLTNEPAQKSGSFELKNEVERIVILGVSKPVKVLLNNNPGSVLIFGYEPSRQELVIRKPKVSINENWSIDLVL
eukprot:GILK01003313.1.p1 GENE.GILK01003313.1~~GILK01003313.1.p1  ORF type:complete len:953 (+),score=172.61 GILK01003313.1:342-2861(+)